MALAEPIGRARAHELIRTLSAEAITTGVAFTDIVSRDPVVNEHLSKDELDKALDLRSQTGLAGTFIDRVLDRHRAG